MDQGEAIALGLALGFALGWLTAWIQSECYWRERAEESGRSVVYWCRRVADLEKALEKEKATVDRIGALLDLELMKVAELRSQLRTLVELELAQAEQEQEQPR